MEHLSKLSNLTLASALEMLLPALERAGDVLADYGYFNEAREAFEVLALARHKLGLPIRKNEPAE